MATKTKGKRYESLMEKIAKQLNQDVNEVKELAKPDLYTVEDKMLQGQSIINYYRSVVAAKEPTQGASESKLDFQKRLSAWHAARNEWRYRECEGCNLRFAYAYHYEGVKYCTLECLETGLRKIGIEVTPGKPPEKRWGLIHPAVVPASALTALQSLSSSDSHDASSDGQ